MDYKLVTGGRGRVIAEGENESSFINNLKNMPNANLDTKWVKINHLDNPTQYWPARSWLAARQIQESEVTTNAD